MIISLFRRRSPWNFINSRVFPVSQTRNIYIYIFYIIFKQNNFTRKCTEYHRRTKNIIIFIIESHTPFRLSIKIFRQFFYIPSIWISNCICAFHYDLKIWTLWIQFSYHWNIGSLIIQVYCAQISTSWT